MHPISDRADGSSRAAQAASHGVSCGRVISLRRSWLISATRSCVLAPTDRRSRATRTASCPSRCSARPGDHAARRMRRRSIPLDGAADRCDRRRMPAARGPGRGNTMTRFAVNRPAFIEDHAARRSDAHRDLVSRRSDGQTRARPLRRRAARIDRPALRAHTVTEAVHLRTVAVVRLVGPFALGHRMTILARCDGPGSRRPASEYTGRHHRWPRLLTTERASRPLRTRAVWKTTVLSSSPPSPGA